MQEIELGLAADVGTLQRLPKVVGNDSLARELCYTARPFMAREAESFGLVRLLSGFAHLLMFFESFIRNKARTFSIKCRNLKSVEC